MKESNKISMPLLVYKSVTTNKNGMMDIIAYKNHQKNQIYINGKSQPFPDL